MFINELEIHNISECKHALLKFPMNLEKSSIYLVHSSQKCDIISLALQLICGTKYSTSSALHDIQEKIYKAKVRINFNLKKSGEEQNFGGDKDVRSHSSDSDVPCTSKQAGQRLKRRLERRSYEQSQKDQMIINACRDFTLNPDVIVYSVNNGPLIESKVLEFQVRFFSCTETIFPRLSNISYGDYCKGKWLDLLSLDFVQKGGECHELLLEFCQLFSQQNLPQTLDVCQLTTSILTARNYLQKSSVSHLISIFNDIRWLFEYLTCAEYTVWFLLPSVFGNLQDITKITTKNTNFDLMKTQIQLKNSKASSYDWLRAEEHIQELLMIAVQLAFGYHCHQNIIYLHSLNYLEQHQSFEFLNFSLIQSNTKKQLLFEKNYFQRIFNICSKLQICCVLEFCGGLPCYPRHPFVISGNWLEVTQEWQFTVKDLNSEQQEITTESVNNFLQQIMERLK